MENETPEGDSFEAVDPGFGADASPESEEEPVEAEAKAEEPEDTEESEAESPPADEDNVEKKTDAFQDRIDKLTTSFRDSERREDGLREENAALQRKLNDVPAPEVPSKSLADFNYDENAYRNYLFKEVTDTATKAAERVVQNNRETSRAETVADKFAEREKVFEKTVPNYREKMYDDSLRISTVMRDELHESDIGPQMGFYLASKPDEASRISKLSAREVIRELAALESTLRAESEKHSKTVSDAPPPPAKVRGKTPGITPASTDPASDKLSDEQWFKLEEKRQLKLRR
jgi:hypothetical protein